MEALPISLFSVTDWHYIGVELTMPDAGVRFLVTPADSAAGAIQEAAETETAMAKELHHAFTERFVYRMQVGGVAHKPGTLLDFVVSNRSGHRRIGVHAMAVVNGIDEAFLRRLTTSDQELENLLIVTNSSPEECAAAAAALQSFAVPINIEGNWAGGSLAGKAANDLWNKLAEDLEAPARASFKV